MPVATSSRRKLSSRRQLSSDIEEERPSQSKVNEQVDEHDDDDDNIGRRRTNGIKREKKNGDSSRKGKKRVNDDEDGTSGDDKEDDDDNDNGRINVENFRNQPIGRPELGRLQGFSQDWVQMERQVRQNWSVIGDVATSVAEVAEGDDADQELNELDRIMKDLIDISAEMKAHEMTISDIYQQVGQGKDIDDVVDRYEAGVLKRIEEYAKKTTRQKYAKSEEYASFRQGIFEIQFPDKAIPPITNFIDKEDGDDSDDDDELEIGGVTQNYNCPITLTALVNPLTSEVCGHSFSADAIRQTFKGSRVMENKCPASGCNKRFKLSDLKPNKDLAKKVKAWERRNKRAAEHSDAEEIIE